MGYEAAVVDGAPACIRRPGAALRRCGVFRLQPLAENGEMGEEPDRADGMMPLCQEGGNHPDFVLETAETGNDHISVSGHQAKGNVSFTLILGEMEWNRRKVWRSK